MARVIPFEELTFSPTATLFEGGDDTLRVVSVHPSGALQQTNL
ncbi:MAG TPA: hypothetical protein VF066_03185 [Thermoleophilaceae bacterium]